MGPLERRYRLRSTGLAVHNGTIRWAQAWVNSSSKYAPFELQIRSVRAPKCYFRAPKLSVRAPKTRFSSAKNAMFEHQVRSARAPKTICLSSKNQSWCDMCFFHIASANISQIEISYLSQIYRIIAALCEFYKNALNFSRSSFFVKTLKNSHNRNEVY